MNGEWGHFMERFMGFLGTSWDHHLQPSARPVFNSAGHLWRERATKHDRREIFAEIRVATRGVAEISQKPGWKAGQCRNMLKTWSEWAMLGMLAGWYPQISCWPNCWISSIYSTNPLRGISINILYEHVNCFPVWCSIIWHIF